MNIKKYQMSPKQYRAFYSVQFFWLGQRWKTQWSSL